MLLFLFSAHDNENKYGKITKISFGVRERERQGLRLGAEQSGTLWSAPNKNADTPRTANREKQKEKTKKKQKKQKKNNSSFRAIIENQRFEEQKV